MGEIIQFPGVGAGEEKGDDGRSTFTFPSIGEIFDEERVMINKDGSSVSVASFKLAMTAQKRTNVLRNFETSLTQARVEYISENAKTPTVQQEALIGLAKHAYAVARELEHVELMDWATAELSRGLGVQQAMIIIENIQLKARLEGKE
jgi:hypothetical protein